MTAAGTGMVGQITCPFCKKNVTPAQNGCCPECRTDLALLSSLQIVVNSLVAEGTAALNSGDAATAASSFKIATQLRAQDPELLLATAEALLLTGSTVEASKFADLVPTGADDVRLADIRHKINNVKTEGLRTRGQRTLQGAIAIAAIFSFGVLTPFVVNRIDIGREPSPVPLAENAAKSIAQKFPGIGVKAVGSSEVKLDGSVDTEARALSLVSYAAQTGAAIDSSGLSVRAPLNRVLSSTAKLAEQQGGVAWTYENGRLVAAGTLKTPEAVRVLGREASRELSLPTDVSRVGYAGTLVVVKPGDSLWTIAKRIYGDGDQYYRIRSSNGELLQSSNLKLGETLYVPVPTHPGDREKGN